MISLGQERLWFLHRLDPADPAYRVAVVRRLRGPLDADALEAAFADVVARHESLRTRFPDQDGLPVAVVDPPRPVPVERAEVSGPEEAERLFAARAAAPFDLAAAPPLRVTLARLDAGDHVLGVVLHHVIADGWSLNVLMDDLAACYLARRDGVPAALPPLPVRYADHAAAQRAADASADLEHWTDRLAGAPVLELPADRPRPARRSSRGRETPFELPPGLTGALSRLARAERCTLFMVLLAAYQLLLSRHSGQDDVVVGTPTAGRDRPELEPMVGLFASTMVLRGDLSGDPSFVELLRRTRKVVLEAMAHRDVPIERVLSALDIERDLSRTPLFQAMLALHNAATGYGEAAAFAGLESTPFPHGDPSAMVDVRMELWPDGAGLRGALHYSAELFEPDTMERMAARFVTLLTSIAARPDARIGELDLLPPAERELVTAAWNRTALDVPEGTVADLVLRQAERRPDAVAVECAGERVTYRDLAERARRVAADLRARGAGPGSVVALRLPRSADLPGALLGVMLSGAAYLPIDRGLPDERVAYMLEDSGARLTLGDLPPAPRPATLPVTPGREAAYVLYTSGSTGRPKGVVVPHTALVNLLAGMAALLGSSPSDTWLGSTSLSFDIAGLELYLPLVTGGRLVAAGDEEARDGAALARLITSSGVTHVQATPSGWSMLLSAGLDPAGLVALAGGEALPLSLARRLRGRVARLLNMYGPTETTIWSTAWEVPPAPERVSIGRPIANTTVHVLDASGGPAPVGVPGELVIGGAGVALGYLGRPELTAERFADGRYLTGDRARWLGDGTLEFLGRADGQVKLRGHRIETGEVEAALESHPAVERAAVVVRGEDLVAYVAVGTGGVAVPEGLARHLAAWLPAYMVPNVVVPLPALPLTPNGKVDRLALPEPAAPEAGRGGAPRTDRERQVARIFGAVLGLPEVGVDDDFFALGGHSLLATQVVARLEAAGTPVPLRELFAHPTVAALAALLEHVPEERARPLRPRPAGTLPPLSPAQERLWFLHRLDPADASYTMFVVRRLRGPLDRARLRAALSGVVARHEALRTRFPEVDGRPVAVVERPAPVAVEELDARDEAEARALVAARTNAPFDLGAAPPLRVTLIRLADGDHVLCAVMHHIVADGWSIGVFLDDLAALYAGTRPEPPAVQQGDVARWQRDRDGAAALEYWRERLAAPPVLELRTDRPHVESPARGGHHVLELPEELAGALEAVARRERATLFMVLLAAYQLLLSRHTGQDDVLVGTPTAGRDRVELERVVGYLSNTLVLRGDLSGDPTLAELLDRTRGVVLEAMAHQDVPFERLLAELDVERDLTRKPVFQTMLALNQGGRDERDRIGDLEMTYFDDGYRQAKFDLTVEAWRSPGLLRVAFGYDAGLFDAETVRRLAERFAVLLEAVADPARLGVPVSRLPVLTGEDEELLAAGHGPGPVGSGEQPGPVGSGEQPGLVGSGEQPGLVGSGEESVPEMVARAVSAYPDRVAVVCGEQSVTYGELERRVTALATELARHGVRDGIVGLRLGRSVEAVVAMLAAWRAGAAYLPLDPAHPPARLDRLAAEAGVRATVTGTLAVLPGVPAPREEPGLAYVLHTSGSTGAPKGVAVEHAGLAARVRWMREAYELRPGDQVVQLAPLGSDTHAEELYPALAAGATVVVVPGDGGTLPDLLAERPGVTVLDLPTAYFHQLVDVIDDVAWPAALRLVILGGEQVEGWAVARWRERFGGRVRLVNTYGPTETTIIATAAELTGAADLADGGPRPPIGRPVAGIAVRVLDRHGQAVPPGAPGELHIGGAGVARGYLGRPDLTAERFADVAGTRWFRTGDAVRLRPDGALEFLGRLDEQVKIRGFRVEPGEVEHCLLGCPGVRRAAVVARDGELVAYVVGETADAGKAAAAGETAGARKAAGVGETAGVGKAAAVGEAARLAEHAARTLPPYMVPAHWVMLDALPLTPNGKLDRAALPAPGRPEGTDRTPPRSDAEELVADVWAEVLDADKVGAFDDFFALGGHSLLAVKVAARLRALAGIDLPIRTLFARRTVAELALAVEEALVAEVAGLSDEQARALLDAEDLS
ncbi:amino acid adenylation domain-containing protein [Nonomuraea sp. SMC257]|uniref:Amino acid adenylation domain-containing protein n=1 Tax=Nonomuraea montanisoli TaxID=2741721 RepID=A0A7Y6IED4_9ACTN|nr:non-ribosomal peptide synthetase [Nonomuraea montanisoli]NUW36735.1 amino acid adenylation domain-containing protein [Nonomuraea montanisoli]